MPWCPPSAAAFELGGVISSVQGQHEEEPSLVVVGGGAAGVYASIRAKTLAPHLNVAVVEKGRFLSKVKVSGGGRCNVTNGHHLEPMVTSNLASYSYPGRGRCPRHHPACHCRSRVAANIFSSARCSGVCRDWRQIIQGGTRSSEDPSLPLTVRRIPCVGSQITV